MRGSVQVPVFVGVQVWYMCKCGVSVWQGKERKKKEKNPHLQALQRHGRSVLVNKLRIDGPDHVVCNVVAHVQVLHLPELVQLFKDVLIEVL